MTEVIFNEDGQPVLRGARDPQSGEYYFPFRPLTADGTLRACEETLLSTEGILYTWTRFAGRFYGQIDLPEAVRIQTELGDGPHDIGATYRLTADRTDDKIDWRFERVWRCFRDFGRCGAGA
ncbi:MAG: hypothetical protein WDA25_10030 [Paracoccaceae bacterium]